MNIKRTVGEKGQVVVPKDIREHLGIKPGSEVIFEVRGKEIVLKPGVDPKKFVEEFCSIRKKVKRRLDLKDIKKITEEQYEVR